MRRTSQGRKELRTVPGGDLIVILCVIARIKSLYRHTCDSEFEQVNVQLCICYFAVGYCLVYRKKIQCWHRCQTQNHRPCYSETL